MLIITDNAGDVSRHYIEYLLEAITWQKDATIFIKCYSVYFYILKVFLKKIKFF